MRTAALCFALLGVVAALHLRPAKPAAPAAKPALQKERIENLPVFYSIVMSRLASKHQTRLYLSSLRTTGQWKGAIVMVTDQPECLSKNLGAELLGGAKLPISTETYDVYPGGKGNGKVFILKQPVTGNVKVMKQEKAFAWKNMAKVGLTPSFIVYTDQDIVMGKDVNVVVNDAKANLEGKGHTMALFIDQGVTKGQLHTGIILLFPGAATEQCLADWGSKIISTSSSKYHGFDRQQTDAQLSEEAGAALEAESMGPDQRALGKTGSCKAGKGIAILDKTHLMMPTSGKLNGKQTATFIHFTNTNRWKSINNGVMKKYFEETLGLAAQEWFDYEKC